MNKTISIGILVFIVVLFAVLALTGRLGTLFPAPSNGEPGAITMQESFEAAQKWVMTTSPTYVFDGSDLTLASQQELIPGQRYQCNFSFTSAAAGYGDRTGQMVAQVITPHTMEVTIENGQVISAITDGVFDEIRGVITDQSLPDQPGVINDTPETLSIRLYFVTTSNGQEQLTSVEREIPFTAEVERVAIEHLLQGPSSNEQAAGITSSLRQGTRLQSIDVQEGVVVADFNPQLDQGVAGSAWVTMIRQQIELTLLQFDSVDEVVISIDGRIEDVLQP